MPARTRTSREPFEGDGRAFNGGAGTCPPGPERGTAGEFAVLPSMEGRARARPDRHDPVPGRAGSDPSMEGRARARPDLSVVGRHRARGATFNGGAGTCPPGPEP